MYIGDMTAPSPKVSLTGTTAEVTLIPIIFAERYDLYHNGVLIKTIDPLVDDLRFTVTGLLPGENSFTYTASKFDNYWNRLGTTAQSKAVTVTVTQADYLRALAPGILRNGLSTSQLVLSANNRANLTLVLPGLELIIATNVNNRNVSGVIALPDGSGTLRFDIKGNGSNISVFRVD